MCIIIQLIYVHTLIYTLFHHAIASYCTMVLHHVTTKQDQTGSKQDHSESFVKVSIQNQSSATYRIKL